MNLTDKRVKQLVSKTMALNESLTIYYLRVLLHEPDGGVSFETFILCHPRKHEEINLKHVCEMGPINDRNIKLPIYNCLKPCNCALKIKGHSSQ